MTTTPGRSDRPRRSRPVPGIPPEQRPARQDDVAFPGLGGYWYPVLCSTELRHNRPRPLTVLGADLVFFRDPDGRARALDNRCPHRGAFLSLGQVGVWTPGTITCRYHGMTFDGAGRCVAYLADGPDSPAVGRITARSHPVDEHAGIVWVHPGDAPAPLLEHQPYAREALAGTRLPARLDRPAEHLALLERAAGRDPDPGAPAAPDGRGRPHGHLGPYPVGAADCYLPGVVRHASVDGVGSPVWLWSTPREVGRTTAWVFAGPPGSPLARIPTGRRRRAAARLLDTAGAPPPWEPLPHDERPIGRVRRALVDAHRAEVASRHAHATTRPATARPRT